MQSPYCLDPGGTGSRASFSYLADGVSPELLAGDTVYLCAGACDGSGSATYNLQTTGTAGLCGEYFFDPKISGTSSSPITIRTYPGETVTLNGDTNGDGTYASGEVRHMFSNSGGRSWYKLMGFKVVKTGSDSLCFRGAGAPNWTIDGLTISEADSRVWGLTGPIAGVSGCGSGGQGAHTVYLTANTGPFTITNSTMHTACLDALRLIANPDAGSSFTITNNEMYNVVVGVETFDSHDMLIAGNYIHDFSTGIGIEDRTYNITIEDNTVACVGAFSASSDGRCTIAISISDGDLGWGGYQHDIMVRRNKVYATNAGGASPYTNKGRFLGGIEWSADCATAVGCGNINGTIENNMLWGVRALFSGHYIGRGAIDIDANKPITVQNNTIYDSRYAIQLDGAGGVVNHIVRNNLVSTCSGECVVAFPNGGSGSGIVANNFHRSSGTVLGFCADSLCDSYASTYTSGTLASSFGQSNKSAPTTFERITGSVADYSLHLLATDTVNKDSGTTSPDHDFDRQPRTAPTDIGADEVVLSTGPLSAVVSLSPPPPIQSGSFLLKAGSWTVTLTANRPIVNVPTPLTFTAQGGGQVTVTLTGAVPGTVFTGLFTVGTSVAEGSGIFSLAQGALVDSGGITGQTISSGANAIIDRTAPPPPANLVFQ